MCLKLDQTSKQLSARQQSLKIRGSRVYYKAYSYTRGRLYSIFQGEGHINAGWVVSDRSESSLSENDLRYGDVGEGIHVYARKQDARREHIGAVIVEVIGHSRDLVAFGTEFGNPGAVFMKVWLSKAEKDKALKAG